MLNLRPDCSNCLLHMQRKCVYVCEYVCLCVCLCQRQGQQELMTCSFHFNTFVEQPVFSQLSHILKETMEQWKKEPLLQLFYTSHIQWCFINKSKHLMSHYIITEFFPRTVHTRASFFKYIFYTYRGMDSHFNSLVIPPTD